MKHEAWGTELTMLKDLRTISSTEKDIQNFSRVVGGVLVFLGVFSFFFGGDRFSYFFVGGGMLLLLGELAPRVLKPIQRVWMMFSVALGLMMTRLILALLFYVVVTPIALIARLVGKRFLDVRWDSEATTYWNQREPSEKSKESYTQQF